jgi:hypothetical protein
MQFWNRAATGSECPWIRSMRFVYYIYIGWYFLIGWLRPFLPVFLDFFEQLKEHLLL